MIERLDLDIGKDWASGLASMHLKINEAIERTNQFEMYLKSDVSRMDRIEQEVNEQKKKWESPAPWATQEDVMKLQSEVNNHHKLITNPIIQVDQPCEHEGEEYCAKCGDPVYKPVPADLRIDYVLPKHLRDIQSEYDRLKRQKTEIEQRDKEKVIATYRAELKQKIEAMRNRIADREGYYNQGQLDSLYEVICLLEEE